MNTNAESEQKRQFQQRVDTVVKEITTDHAEVKAQILKLQARRKQTRARKRCERTIIAILVALVVCVLGFLLFFWGMSFRDSAQRLLEGLGSNLIASVVIILVIDRFFEYRNQLEDEAIEEEIDLVGKTVLNQQKTLAFLSYSQGYTVGFLGAVSEVQAERAIETLNLLYDMMEEMTDGGSDHSVK